MVDLHALPYLTIFASYFLLIAFLFGLILQSLRISATSSPAPAPKGKAAVFALLALGSLAHTWFYMFEYMSWSFTTYEHLSPPRSLPLLTRFAAWLTHTSLFEQAWAVVCIGPINWWWSEQLCLYTVGAWTVFLAVEGHRHKIKHLWAYMLLGQLVAISVASNLFFFALALSPPAPSSSARLSASPRLWIPTLLSLLTVALSPHTDEKTFLPNLLVMHALLVVPLLPLSSSSVVLSRNHPSAWTMRTSTLYLLTLLLALPIRALTVQRALASLPPSTSLMDVSYNLLQAAWTTLHAHPAQSSIGWDVVWSSSSFIAWIALGAGMGTGTGTKRALEVAYLLLATPWASVGVTAPYILRRRGEDETEEGEGSVSLKQE